MPLTCTDTTCTVRDEPSRHGWFTSHNPWVAGSSPARPTAFVQVSELRRLGHSTVAFTLDGYSHTIPSLHQDAAEKIAALLV